VFDLEFRGPDLYISAENGTFILNFNNMSLHRLAINDSINFYGMDIPSENGPVYLGSSYGVHIYYPDNGTLRFFDPIGNRTNPEEGNFTNFGRLAPGGIYVHPTENIVYIYTDVYSDLLELNLNSGEYTYLNNLTFIKEDEVYYVWNDERVGMVYYSEELDDLIILTHHGLRNGSYGKDERLPQTACLNSIYLDEEEDILFALTGHFFMYSSTGPIPSWPSGSPWGFFMINLTNGTYVNYLNEDGMPWMSNKGFHYDEDRERFYFAGGRCFYWIDRDDLNDLSKAVDFPQTNIKILSEDEILAKNQDDSEKDDDKITFIILIAIVFILIAILIIFNLRFKRRGQFLNGTPFKTRKSR
jgi:hypothetical protein